MQKLANRERSPQCSEFPPVDPSATPASEDFGSFGADWHVHSVFRFVAGTNPETHAKAKDIVVRRDIHLGVFVSLSEKAVSWRSFRLCSI